MSAQIHVVNEPDRWGDWTELHAEVEMVTVENRYEEGEVYLAGPCGALYPPPRSTVLSSQLGEYRIEYRDGPVTKVALAPFRQGKGNRKVDELEIRKRWREIPLNVRERYYDDAKLLINLVNTEGITAEPPAPAHEESVVTKVARALLVAGEPGLTLETAGTNRYAHYLERAHLALETAGVL